MWKIFSIKKIDSRKMTIIPNILITIPVLIMSMIFTCPLSMIIAFGGVAKKKNVSFRWKFERQNSPIGKMKDKETAMQLGRIKWAGWIRATRASNYEMKENFVFSLFSHRNVFFQVTMLSRTGNRMLAAAKLLENSVKTALNIVTKSTIIVFELPTRKPRKVAKVFAKSDALNRKEKSLSKGIFRILFFFTLKPSAIARPAPCSIKTPQGNVSET